MAETKAGGDFDTGKWVVRVIWLGSVSNAALKQEMSDLNNAMAMRIVGQNMTGYAVGYLQGSETRKAIA